MTTNNLMIMTVDCQYTSEYMANVFWKNKIAKVRSITLIPYWKNTQYYYIAYITIAEWCDTETAYNFISRLNDPNKEARIVHHDDEWWSVQINIHNNGKLNVGSYTRHFDSAYFERNFDFDCYEKMKSERQQMEEDYYSHPVCVIPGTKEADNLIETMSKQDPDKPIIGLNNIRYSLDDAEMRLKELEIMHDSMDDEKPSSKEYRAVRDEMNLLQKQFRKIAQEISEEVRYQPLLLSVEKIVNN